MFKKIITLIMAIVMLSALMVTVPVCAEEANEVTKKFSWKYLELIKVTQTVAEDGSKTQTGRVIKPDGQNYISEGSGTDCWYLVKVKVGQDWSSFSNFDLSANFGMYRTNTTDKRGYNVGFGAMVDADSYESLASGETLTSLVKPFEDSDAEQNVFSGSSGNGNYWAGSNNSSQTRHVLFNEETFDASGYKDGYLYLAFQALNRNEQETDFARYIRLVFNTNNGDKKEYWNLTVKGTKKDVPFSDSVITWNDGAYTVTTASTEGKAMLVFASFNGNNMVDAKIVMLDASTAVEGVISGVVDGLSDGETVKAFLWDNTSPEPVTGVTYFN